MSTQRYLCSHLVRIFRDSGSSPPETVVLEEIAPAEAILRTGRVYEIGALILIEAEGFLAPARVAVCRPSEGDQEVRAIFSNGFVWNRTAWEPDHLYPARPAARSRGVGGPI